MNIDSIAQDDVFDKGEREKFSRVWIVGEKERIFVRENMFFGRIFLIDV